MVRSGLEVSGLLGLVALAWRIRVSSLREYHGLAAIGSPLEVWRLSAEGVGYGGHDL